MTGPIRTQGARAALRWALLALTVSGLVADAGIHWRLSATYAGARSPGHLNEGTLFRVQAVLAALAAVALLARPRGRSLWLLAAAVAGSAACAVTLTRYVDLGPLGPLPDLYEPTWQGWGKVPSVCAEGLATAAALAGCLLTHRAHRGRAGVTRPSRPELGVAGTAWRRDALTR